MRQLACQVDVGMLATQCCARSVKQANRHAPERRQLPCEIQPITACWQQRRKGGKSGHLLCTHLRAGRWLGCSAELISHRITAPRVWRYWVKACAGVQFMQECGESNARAGAVVRRKLVGPVNVCYALPHLLVIALSTAHGMAYKRVLGTSQRWWASIYQQLMLISNYLYCQLALQFTTPTHHGPPAWLAMVHSKVQHAWQHASQTINSPSHTHRRSASHMCAGSARSRLQRCRASACRLNHSWHPSAAWAYG